MFLLVLLAYHIDYYNYFISDERQHGAFLIISFLTLAIFPLLTVVLLRALDFIKSFQMHEKQERILPLLISCLFYIWYFVNLKDNTVYPDSLRAIALGAAITVTSCFFINNFSKISLHSAAAGAFVFGVILLFIYTNTGYIALDNIINYRLSSIFVIFLSILLAGLVGTARLSLNAHKLDDLYGGYLVGIISQLAAFKIIF